MNLLAKEPKDDEGTVDHNNLSNLKKRKRLRKYHNLNKLKR